MAKNCMVTILFRKSTHYPEKVICAAFDYATPDINRDVIQRWKAGFIARFPEFRNAEFTTEDVPIHPKAGII